jgi:hypothetical protein
VCTATNQLARLSCMNVCCHQQDGCCGNGTYPMEYLHLVASTTRAPRIAGVISPFHSRPRNRH